MEHAAVAVAVALVTLLVAVVTLLVALVALLVAHPLHKLLFSLVSTAGLSSVAECAGRLMLLLDVDLARLFRAEGEEGEYLFVHQMVCVTSTKES